MLELGRHDLVEFQDPFRRCELGILLYCSIHTYDRIEVDIGRRYIENHAAASFRFVSPGIN
jgi:hypothetical protein